MVWVPPEMPPSGMVTTSMKLWAMVAQVMSLSPSSGPPQLCSTAFMEIIIMLSTKMMRKGEMPVTSMRPTSLRLYRPKPMRTGTLRPKSTPRTYTQLASWESTVATAAPATPMSKAKMKSGSSTMLSTAPSTTENMPFFAKPWLIMNWFMPRERRLNTVPQR